jgi:hypothetical protein
MPTPTMKPSQIRRMPFSLMPLFRATALATCLVATASGQALAADAMPGMSKGAPRPELGSSAVFAPDGSLLVAAKQGEHVMIYRSADEGKSWSAPAAVNPNQRQFPPMAKTAPRSPLPPMAGYWCHGRILSPSRIPALCALPGQTMARISRRQ